MHRFVPHFVVRVQPEGATEPVRLATPVAFTKLSFVDNEKGADTLKLTIDNYNLSLTDSPVIAEGAVLHFQFGYADGVMSPPRKAVVTKVNGLTTLTVEAKGQEFVMNCVPRSRIFRNVKRSDVARTLAEENGFPTEAQFIDDTKVVLDQITQANETDAVLLRRMANTLGFEWTIDHLGFHFRPRDMSQKPVRKLTYFIDPGRGDFLEAPTIEVDAVKRPGSVTLRGIDPKTKEIIDVKGTNETTAGRGGLGAEVQAEASGDNSSAASAPPIGYQAVSRTGAQGEVVYGIPTDVRTGQDAVAPTTAKTKEEAQQRANAAYTKAQQGAVKIKGKIIGDPSLTAKSIVEIAGISRFSGLYYITKVGQDWEGTGVTSFEGRRDNRALPTSSGRSTTSAAAVNDQKAPGATSDGSADGTTEMEEYQAVSRDGRQSETRYVPKGSAKR